MIRIRRKTIDSFLKDLRRIQRDHGMYIDYSPEFYSLLRDGDTGFVIGELHDNCDFQETEGNIYD